MREKGFHSALGLWLGRENSQLSQRGRKYVATKHRTISYSTSSSSPSAIFLQWLLSQYFLNCSCTFKNWLVSARQVRKDTISRSQLFLSCGCGTRNTYRLRPTETCSQAKNQEHLPDTWRNSFHGEKIHANVLLNQFEELEGRAVSSNNITDRCKIADHLGHYWDHKWYWSHLTMHRN